MMRRSRTRWGALVALLVSLGWVVGALSAQPALPPPQEVIINGVVMTEIAGTLFPAPANNPAAPSILMLPQVSGFASSGAFTADRAALVPLAQGFQASGFTVLTITLDGYVWDGNAVDGLADVQAAYDFLIGQPGVDAGRSAVLGASIGANYAMQLMAANPLITTGIFMSPAPDYGGVVTDPAALTGRNVITYYGTDEVGDPALAGYIDQFPVVTTPGTGHGVELFADPAAVQPAVAGWVSIMTAPPDRATENPFGAVVSAFFDLCNALFIAEGALGMVVVTGWRRRRLFPRRAAAPASED